ncbi:Lrp/AsnC family transcriptional regulator [Halopenitus persicus]|uniref:Transcriptional regulator, AsnC family n=1 Tax=Halopenitus persicus TaxID=1048396 RepID=A0A1H3KI81_9EURY|nr:Lrp/AsnC family transcriptional regulator [Halopenitus persicus]QHS17841.1 Lrp/AsnC family transcriptional regulator [haloarchaeon 3A1-DGR]SDY51922.1 transcriptional regulator, AsnC family [Halopenitus persicus]
MSVTAYVMVKANTGEADRLKADLAALEGVETVSIVAGDVDFIVTVSVETPADVKDVAATAIQELDGVESTRTYVAME